MQGQRSPGKMVGMFMGPGPPLKVDQTPSKWHEDYNRRVPEYLISNSRYPQTVSKMKNVISRNTGG